MTDRLRHNANLVDALGSAFRSGDHGLKTVPALLKRVLVEESWQEFITQRGDHVRHERFADFVVQPPLAGIGASVDLIRRIVSPDTEAADLLDQALQGRHGGDRSKSDNITLADTAGGRGTSKDYALRRLRKDAPEIHARVLAGELSPHAAMVEAGLRPMTFTVRGVNAESVAGTLRRRLSPEMLAEVARLLTS